MKYDCTCFMTIKVDLLMVVDMLCIPAKWLVLVNPLVFTSVS